MQETKVMFGCHWIYHSSDWSTVLLHKILETIIETALDCCKTTVKLLDEWAVHKCITCIEVYLALGVAYHWCLV